MKKFKNVLKKITVVAVLGMLIANAFTIATYKSHTNSNASAFVCLDADMIYVCEKDEKPDPDRRPLGDLDFD